MNKFMENAIQKQKEAYRIGWAVKQFNYSCDRCASKNLLHISCEKCPVRQAYITACEEIEAGIRKSPKKFERNIQISKDRFGHVTLTLNNCSVTININGKEVDTSK